MTKHFCDICGKELSENDFDSLYSVCIEPKYDVRTNDNCLNFFEVCDECASKVFGFISELKDK